MRSTLQTSLVLGIALLLATVTVADTHVGDWDVTGEITASGNFATFGDSSYVTPFSGWSGSSRMVAVRQPTAVSSGVSAGFMFSNNQTGNAQNIAQLMFLNEAIGVAEKRVAQILVQTGGTTNSGKMFFRVYNAGSATNALTINRFGTVTVGDGLTFPDGETQTTAFMGATGGGYDNSASGGWSTVGGGYDNSASGGVATVGGGWNNAASAYCTTVGGGRSNLVTDQYGTIGGGFNSQAGDDAGTASDAQYATVSGGHYNDASGGGSTVSGGGYNDASASYATVGGGDSNVVTDDYGTIGGGGDNHAGDDAGTTIDAMYATVGGGQDNTAGADSATVGGGSGNDASGGWSTVSGGNNNTASGAMSVVAGGDTNTATNATATVSGGYLNNATGHRATVPGGYSNSAAGSYSFAGGYVANANHDNSFVWGDSGGGSSAAANTFNVHASGGIFHEGGSIHTPSDRNKKENFEAVDSRAVLAKVAALPMSTWNYKTEDGGYRHMGPMGQDFHAAFGLGTDDKHITTVDADGVALAAIQGLYKAGVEKDAQIKFLQKKVAALEAVVGSLMEK